MVKRKRTPRIVKDIFIPLRFGIGTTIIGAAGTATGPLLPAGTVNPLTSISQAGTSFIGPLTAVVGTGILVREIRKLKPSRRRKT